MYCPPWRVVESEDWRAKGPKPYQPGATPQVESPSHPVADSVAHCVADHVPDATQLMPDLAIRDASDRYLGRCPRLV